ncbi:MAG: adenosylmethionine--8-amino-7-oxononanoate transaminase, partial [Pseudomonadales bacterium]|nr:adenosylmethionine--8-amino-7-oxononanoate transaminase [Pseudomonadales bacterium]
MNKADLDFDAAHIWHPYSNVAQSIAPLPIISASGVHLQLADGRHLVDGMSSWWAAIHGYNHPAIIGAAQQQLQQLPHVMFGGLTHQPAVDLCRQLVELSPAGLEHVFLSDSGSVAVDVALKMALQYWQTLGQAQKTRFVALRGGYHGDTLGAMSVCDPVTGMHHLFKDTVAQQFFVPRPTRRFGQACSTSDLAELTQLLETHAAQIAALILEPVVQGAGGMNFYSADYLRCARELCDLHGVLLIADEIATGFGRSGKLFACEHAAISPDIMCVGKAMTGGYLSLAATLASTQIAEGISNGEPGAFMH